MSTKARPGIRPVEVLFSAPEEAPPAAAFASDGPAAAPWRPLLRVHARGRDGAQRELGQGMRLDRPAWLADAVACPEVPAPVSLPEEAALGGALTHAQAEAVGLAMQSFRRSRLPSRDGGKGGPALFVLADAAGAGRRRTAAAVAAAAWLDREPSRRIVWICGGPSAPALVQGSLDAIGAGEIPVRAIQGPAGLEEPLPGECIAVVSPRHGARNAKKIADAIRRWASKGRPLVIAEGPERDPEGDGSQGIWSLIGRIDGARALAVCDVAGPASGIKRMARGLSRALLQMCPEDGGWITSAELCSAVGDVDHASGEALMRSLAEAGALDCRMPSLAGVPVSVEAVPLDEARSDLHRLWTGVWLRIVKGLGQALARARDADEKADGEGDGEREPGAPAAGGTEEGIRKLAEGAHQEMFAHLPSAFVAERVAEIVRASLSRGEAPVVRVVEHCGGSLARRAAEAGRGGTLDMHACSGPAEDFAQLLSACMPTAQMTPRTDRSGKVTMEEAVGESGERVSSPYAVSRRGRAVSACRSAEPLLPAADSVREAAGVPVAEITGRTVRTEPEAAEAAEAGDARKAVRRSAATEAAEARGFSAGALRALIASDPEGRALPKAPSGRPVRLVLAGADGMPGTSVQAAMSAMGMASHGAGLAGVDIVVPELPLQSRLARDAAAMLADHGADGGGCAGEGDGRVPFGRPPATRALRDAAHLMAWTGEPLSGLTPEETAMRLNALPALQSELHDRVELFQEVLCSMPGQAQAKALEGLDARSRAELPGFAEAGRARRNVGVVEGVFEEIQEIPLAAGGGGAGVLELRPESGRLPGPLVPSDSNMEFSVLEAAWIAESAGEDAIWSVPKGPGKEAWMALRLASPRRGGEAPWLCLGPGAPPELVLSKAPPGGGAKDPDSAPRRVAQKAEALMLDGWAETGVDVDRLAAAWSGEEGSEARAFLLCGSLLPLMRIVVHPPAQSSRRGPSGITAINRHLRVLRVRRAGGEERLVPGIPLDPGGLAQAFLLAASPSGP